MNLQLALYFLVILNPFSQILFLGDLMSSMTGRRFAAVYGKASLLSFGVYALFALTGDFLFIDVFRVRVEAFRIFGGVIVFIIALRYFTQGQGSNQFFQGKVSDVASSISIPFMVGPATIWVSMVMGGTSRLPTRSSISPRFCLSTTWASSWRTASCRTSTASATACRAPISRS